MIAADDIIRTALNNEIAKSGCAVIAQFDIIRIGIQRNARTVLCCKQGFHGDKMAAVNQHALAPPDG